jgi:glycosyltransferase involved in cell wall biosynthesis
MPDFLITYHVPANTGYAVEPLEITFFKVVSQFLETSGSGGKIHLGYRNYDRGEPRWLGARKVPLLELDYRNMSSEKSATLEQYIKQHSIKYVLAFDLSIGTPICGVFRRGGVESIFSYRGAPASAINTGIKLLLRRLQVLLIRNKPTMNIFESYGMQHTGTHGSGIAKSAACVVRPGIELKAFTQEQNKDYIYEQFGIAQSRKVFFFAGHMEERKGVHVIVKAAAELINIRGRTDIHFVFCGDRDNEKLKFDRLYKGTAAENYITFGGYRSDIPKLLSGCYAGIIASTGWDSFTFTSMEIGASRLPLLVSDLSGLNEAVVDQKTGLLSKPGDHLQLADNVEYLVDHPAIRDQFGQNAFDRVVREFTVDTQRAELLKVIAAHVARQNRSWRVCNEKASV